MIDALGHVLKSLFQIGCLHRVEVAHLTSLVRSTVEFGELGLVAANFCKHALLYMSDSCI